MSQTHVDFYLLNKATADAVIHFACRLLEKVYLKGHHIVLLCEDEHQAALMDECLWTFSATSFVPHQRVIDNAPCTAPIQIQTDDTSFQITDILLNLSTKTPINCLQFNRILEIVSGNEENKIISRAHYRAYKALNIRLTTHSID